EKACPARALQSGREVPVTWVLASSWEGGSPFDRGRRFDTMRVSRNMEAIMGISIDKLKKLKHSSPLSGDRVGLEGMVEAILKVGVENYVPAGVVLRSRIDPTLFTGEFPGSLLAVLRADPKVQSIELSRKMRPQDPDLPAGSGMNETA